MKFKRVISDGDIMRDIKHVAKKHSGTITVVIYEREGLYSMKTITQRFTSWRRAVLLAGVVPYYERNPLAMRGMNDKDEQRAAMIESRNLRRKQLIDGARKRPCNKCGRDFISTWDGNRRCAVCSNTISKDGPSLADDMIGAACRTFTVS